VLQDDRLAVSEEMHAGGRSQTGDVVGEGHGWQIDEVGALAQADGPPRSPVHGNGMIWVNAADHLRRLPGVEMADAEGRSPAADWYQGDVDVRHLVQRKVWTRIPRVPAPMGARNEVAKRGSTMGAPGEPTAVMVGGQDTYL
jgi:hypothetical protein